MPQNILIEFSSDTTGITTASEAVQQLKGVDQDLAESFTKTNNALKDRDKAQQKVNGSLAQVSDNMKNIQKAAVGAFGTKVIDDLNKKLGTTNTTAKTLSKTLSGDLAKNIQKGLADAGISADQFAEYLKAAGISAEDFYKLFNDGADQSQKKTLSLRQQLAAMRNELATMEEGSPEFNALLKQAGELDDKIKDLKTSISNVGSDTKNIEGVISLASGVAGGFAIAQGAAALFGTENEELQQTLLKVNAAMSILQGLEQVGNVIQKESAASLLLNRILYGQKTVAQVESTIATETNTAATETNTVATEGLVVAEGEQVVATEAATAAQAELNVAMAASPVGIVLLAIAELAGLYTILTKHSQDALKAQKQFNQSFEDTINLNDQIVEAIGRSGEKQAAEAKQNGDSAATVRKIETQALQAQLNQFLANEHAKQAEYDRSTALLKDAVAGRIKLSNDELDAYTTTTKTFEALVSQRIAAEDKLKVAQINNAADSARDKFTSDVANINAGVAATVAGSDAERTAQINAIRAIAAEREKQADFQSKTEGEKNEERANDDKQVRALLLANYQHQLKGETALDEARTAQAKLDLINNQVDSIASIKKINDIEIDSLKKRKAEAESDKTLNEGERLKLTGELNLAIREKEKEQQVELLSIQKAGIDARLILDKQGTAQEYLDKIDSINKEQEIELAATKLTADQIAEINNKAIKAREDAEKALYQARLQNDISYATASLEQYNITENQKLAITLQKLDQERALEISQANNNAAKIFEINAKYDEQERSAKKANLDKQLSDTLAYYDAVNAQSIASAQRVLDNDKSTFIQRDTSLQTLYDSETTRIHLEEAALKASLAVKGIDQKEYDVKILQFHNAEADAENKLQKGITANTLKELEKRTAAFQSAATVLQNGLQAIFGTTGFSTALTELSNFGVKAQDIFAKIALGVEKGGISTIEGIKQLASAAVAATQATVNQIFADNSATRQQNLDDEITALEAQKAAEVGQKNLTEQQKADIDKKYAAKEAAAKRSAFIADQDAKVSQALINGALAVTNILATAPIVSWPFLIPFAVATTAAEVIVINHEKVPKFLYKGEIGIDGPGTETSDSIPAFLSKNESVINAKATKKHRAALEAINSDNYSEYLESIMPKASVDYSTIPRLEMYQMPSLAPLPEWALRQQNKSVEIDYDKMGAAFAKHINNEAKVVVNLDENGHTKYLLEKGNRRKFLNKRYSFKL